MRGEQGAHAEGLAEARDLLAERALADDPERRAVELADRVVEKAELAGALPFAGDHVLPIADQGAPERQDQREGVLGHGVQRVAANVGDDHALRLAGGDVDHVIAGRRDRDQPQIRQTCKRIRVDRNFVGDRDVGTLEPFGDLVFGRGLMLGPVVLECRPVIVTEGPMVARSRKTMRCLVTCGAPREGARGRRGPRAGSRPATVARRSRGRHRAPFDRTRSRFYPTCQLN